MEVVLVACAVLLDVNACSGPCHPTTPTTYYIVLLVSRIRGAGYVVEYNMATVKTPAQRAKHVKLVQIVYYYY